MSDRIHQNTHMACFLVFGEGKGILECLRGSSWPQAAGQKIPTREEVVAFRYIGATKPKHLEEVSSGLFAALPGVYERHCLAHRKFLCWMYSVLNVSKM